MNLPSADDYLPGHGDESYSVRHYDLELVYAVSTNRLDGSATLSVVTRERTRRLVLDLAHLDVAKVRVTGADLAKYNARSERLVLQLREEVDEGTELTVVVRYSGQPRPVVDKHLGDAGWEELADGVIVAAQPHGSPTWFPCNDRPDDKATYRIAVTADAGYRVVSNGRLTEHRRGGSRETWIHEQDEPMATYLATVQIGRYADWKLPAEPTSGVPIQVLAPADLEPAAFADAFGRQHEMMDAFVRLFGPYPFAGYAVVVTGDDLEIPLESQSLSTFGRNLVRGDWGATRLIAHELAHQWFGNAVTLSPLAGHLAARGLRLLQRVDLVGGVRRRVHRQPGPPALGPSRRARPGPGARRPRPGADVRRPGLQARGARPCTRCGSPWGTRPSSTCCAPGSPPTWVAR